VRRHPGRTGRCRTWAGGCRGGQWHGSLRAGHRRAHDALAASHPVWGDTRATAQIDALDAELGGAEVLARCGSVLSTQAVGPKLTWIAEQEPEVFARARRLFMPSSWLAYCLTGAYLLDHQSASQATPLYDTHARNWYAPWVRRIAPEFEMPPLNWATEVAGTVHEEAAARTGLAVLRGGAHPGRRPRRPRYLRRPDGLPHPGRPLPGGPGVDRAGRPPQHRDLSGRGWADRSRGRGRWGDPGRPVDPDRQ